MCSYKPSLEECGYSVDKFGLLRRWEMLILINSSIGCPVISSNATSSFNVIFEKCLKDFSRCIVNSFKPDSAKPSSPLSSTVTDTTVLPSAPRPRVPVLFASNVCFIKLNQAGKGFPVRKDHRLAKLMQNGPSGFIAAKPKSSLLSLGATSMFLPNNPPCRHKPDPKRNSGILKYCSRLYRRTLITYGAHHMSTPCLPMLSSFTSRAIKSIWPADTGKIFDTSFFRFKKLVKLKDISGVVFHLKTLHVVSTAVKGIPQ